LRPKAKTTLKKSVAAENLVQPAHGASELEKLSLSVTRYYDSLSCREEQDEILWAEFAESQLTDPNLEGSF